MATGQHRNSGMNDDDGFGDDAEGSLATYEDVDDMVHEMELAREHGLIQMAKLHKDLLKKALEEPAELLSHLAELISVNLLDKTLGHFIQKVSQEHPEASDSIADALQVYCERLLYPERRDGDGSILNSEAAVSELCIAVADEETEELAFLDSERTHPVNLSELRERRDSEDLIASLDTIHGDSVTLLKDALQLLKSSGTETDEELQENIEHYEQRIMKALDTLEMKVRKYETIDHDMYQLFSDGAAMDEEMNEHLQDAVDSVEEAYSIVADLAEEEDLLALIGTLKKQHAAA